MANNKVKVIVGECTVPEREGFLIIGNRGYETTKDYTEKELTGKEIYDYINKCIPIYTEDAIQNENTKIIL